MTASLKEVETTVPLADGSSVTIEPGQPWPSAYRGSKYSLVSDEDFDDPVLKWEQRDLSVYTEVPDGLWRNLALIGKSGGYGSFRVTAGNEIITKVPAEDYKHIDQAPADSGWIPAYVGKLSGTIDFDIVESDPRAPSAGNIRVWRGFPFNHGERWSVSSSGSLIWTWRDYRFESAFDHQELVDTYEQYRGTAGRLYITESGHVWVNVPNGDIMAGKESQVRNAVASWKDQAEENDDTATLRLVNRRLVATSHDDDPSTGHFPIHLGHLRNFDGGTIPRTIVDDPSYHQAVCEYETVWE